MATCTQCRGVGSVALSGTLRGQPKLQIMVCDICDGTGAVITHDLLVGVDDE